MLRSLRERILQTLAYEAGGLLIAAPIYAWLFGRGTAQSLFLIVALSIAVMVWSPLHNTVFDWLDFRMSGRVASDRPHLLRFVHAISHEATSVIVTLPLIIWFGAHGFAEALMIDIGLTLLYAAYAYIFHLVFDWMRPVAKPLRARAIVTSQSHRPVRWAPPRITQATEKFGVHIMVDGYGAPFHVLDNINYLTKLLQDLPRLIGMNPIASPQIVRVGPLNRKDPGGISGFVMIAESHISFHTFPARGFVTMDLYTCQGDIDCQRTVGMLKRAFQLTDADVFIQDRGLRYPMEDVAAA
jgi:S-adenosylmethionine decarboxylase proenzyme